MDKFEGFPCDVAVKAKSVFEEFVLRWVGGICGLTELVGVGCGGFAETGRRDELGEWREERELGDELLEWEGALECFEG